MKKNINRIISAILAVTLTFSGCYSDNIQSTNTTVSTQPPITTTKKAAALADEDEPVIQKQPLPLNVAMSGINSEYTPFNTISDYDRFLHNVTGIKILYKDRAGKILLKGASDEKSVYSSKFYSYKGTSDVSVSYDEENDISVCDIKLRENLCFSDGTKVTADDLIFTLYALLDPAYSGKIRLSETNIAGLLNYRLNSSIAEDITAEQIEEALVCEEVAEMIKQEIIIPTLYDEYKTVVSLYDDTTYSVYTDAYPDPKDLLAFFISVDSGYKPGIDESPDDVISDLADMYNGNYKLFGSMFTGDENTFEHNARMLAIKYITEKEGASADINSISGIEKTGEDTIRITVIGRYESLIEKLTDVVIAPLHYYGEKNLFDIKRESFGFKKGTDFAEKSAHKGEPLGAGAYKFIEYNDNTVTLCANDDYYKGEPEIKTLYIIEGSQKSAADDISLGKADISFPDSTKEAFAEIESANKSIKKIYLGISRSDGYGYIGINADNVCINNEPFSEESIMLRKAIATAINFYKDSSVKDYYGDNDKVTDYPISIGYSLPSRENLPVPYGINAYGEPIFEQDMHDTERYYKVKNACIGFLKKAGFTFENDKIEGIPEGAETEFTAYVAGGGNENHPSFAALTKASRLLRGIGITLNVIDSADGQEIWNAIESGKQEIWAASYKDSLSTIYSEYGYYGLKNRMDALIDAFENAVSPEETEKAFIDCALAVTDGYAVEIPMYKRDTYTAFSSLRVDISTLPENMTGCYDWTREIETLKMK